MVADPWSRLSVAQVVEEPANTTSKLQFENDFNQICPKQQPALDDQHSASEDYVALDDSEQYLARLERKLNRVSGSSGPLVSRSLLAGLAASRQAHLHSLLADTGPPSSSVGESDYLPRARGVLLSQGQHHLNSIVQKLAPEKLALSAEELVKLLAADSLAARTEREISECETLVRVTSSSGTTDRADAAPADRTRAEQGSGEYAESNASVSEPEHVAKTIDTRGRLSTSQAETGDEA